MDRATLKKAVWHCLTSRLGELDRAYFCGNDTALDVRHIPYETLQGALDELTWRYNVVLHGSGSVEPPYDVLTPKRSLSLFKVPSVFASTDARVALGAGVFAKEHTNIALRYIVDDGNSFAPSMYVAGRTQIFEAPPGIARRIFAALKGWKPECHTTFCDGLSYILDRGDFTQEDPMWEVPGVRRGGQTQTDHEWNADRDVVPLYALRISATLAHSLFTPETVHVYSEEDMLRRRAHRAAAECMLAPGL